MPTIREQITKYALDRDGLFTLDDAAALGIPTVELRKLAHRGKLTRIGRGVYRTEYSRFEPKSEFREALALVGPEAFLIGESALSVHDIGVFNPGRIHIATTKRVRRNLPKTISLHWVKDITAYDVIEYDHVRSESVYSVIKKLIPITESGRIIGAIRDAERYGIISTSQVSELTKIITHRDHQKSHHLA